ncbi:hypothetical protein PENTCL1PPCAC_4871, partial [Pristionchus entomophagus]
SALSAPLPRLTPSPTVFRNAISSRTPHRSRSSPALNRSQVLPGGARCGENGDHMRFCKLLHDDGKTAKVCAEEGSIVTNRPGVTFAMTCALV